MRPQDHPNLLNMLPQLLRVQSSAHEGAAAHARQTPRRHVPEEDMQRYRQEHGEHRAGFYGDLLRLARGINKVTHLAHVPVKLTTHALLDDKRQQREIMDILGAITAMSGAPLAQESLRAGASTLVQSDNRGATARNLSGSAAAGSLEHLLPLLSFLAEGAGHR